MEVIVHGIQLDSVTSTSSLKPVGTQSNSEKRYILDLAGLPSTGDDTRLTITFSAIDRSGDVGEVSLDLLPDREVRSRKWEKLPVRMLSQDCEKTWAEFSAYRLLRDQASNHANQAVFLFDQTDTASFMARIPDGTPLGSLTLPGTHESCALYGFPISQCQQPSTPILQQLMDGVRFLDVRLKVVGDELLMYHGPRPQRSSLKLLLSTLHDFLAAHPTETIILSLKEETPPWHESFSARVYTAFEPYLDEFWFLEERIPTLGEVRGKGMLLTRFDRDKESRGQWPNGMGIHPSQWPDSRIEGFHWHCGGTLFRVQDWYRVKTFLQIPEKFEAIKTHLQPALTFDTSSNVPFTLSYTTASYFPLSLPTTIAKGFGFPSWGLGTEGINSRLCRQILEWMADGQRVRACLAMDFYRQCAGNDGLAGLLVQMNFVAGG